MIKCKNCGWYDNGVCELLSTEKEKQPTEADSYCINGYSRKKYGVWNQPNKVETKKQKGKL